MRAGRSRAGPDLCHTMQTYQDIAKAALVTAVGQGLEKAVAPLCVCLCICSWQEGVFNFLQKGLALLHEHISMHCSVT